MLLRCFHLAVTVCLATVCAQLAGAKPPAAAGLTADYERLSREFKESVRGWRPGTPATGSLLFVAPDQYAPSHVRDRNRDRQNQYADALFELAKRAADAGELSLAFQWATQAVRENPDHTEGRRVLGYE